MSIKCRKCRRPLIDRLSSVCTAHGEPIDTDTGCSDDSWFVVESELNGIEWIKEQLDANNWIKGKLVCPYRCGARLGSYNFINGFKCKCEQHVLPAVHLVKSRVDYQAAVDPCRAVITLNSN